MIKLLKIYDVGEKIRVGNINDGGYVLPKILIEKSNSLFSYGISNDISFDEHYIELTDYKNKVYGYDHTIDSVETKYKNNFILKKEGISSTKEEYTNNFIEHYNQLNINSRSLLKIDVEGAEYEYFNGTDVSELKDKVTGIVVEFHSLSNNEYRNNFFEIVKKLNDYFYISHVHGNNCSSSFEYFEKENKYIMPDVIEITFASKELVQDVNTDKTIYPSNLDSPNNEDKNDYDLSFLTYLDYEIKTYKDLKTLKIEQGTIPKFIFRTGRPEFKHLPQIIKNVYFKDLVENENYHVFYFSDDDCQQSIEDTQDERIINAYNKLIPTAFKSDLWRYVILNKYGGVYLDFSHVSTKSYDYIINNDKEIFLKDKKDECGINNSFIACCKNNEVLKTAIEFCIYNVENFVRDLRVYDVTGPQLLERAFRKIYKIDNSITLKIGMYSLNYNLIDYDYSCEDRLLGILNQKGEEVIKYRHFNNHYDMLYGVDKSVLYYADLFPKKIIYKDDKWEGIKQLYQKLLRREADLRGLVDYYSCETLRDVKLSILKSEEYNIILNQLRKKKLKK